MLRDNNLKKHNRISKQIYLKTAFALYILSVFWLTLFNREPKTRRHKLNEPFWEYIGLVQGDRQWYFFGQIFGNILMLIPLGIFLPLLFKSYRNPLKVTITGMLFSVIIEVTQYITGLGLCEFDDAFNNTLGALIGYDIYMIFNNANHSGIN